MIGAQILTVAHNGIAQASTFQGYILLYFHGTCTMSYFVLLDKTYAAPLTFHALDHKSCDHIWYIQNWYIWNRPKPPTVFPSDNFVPLQLFLYFLRDVFILLYSLPFQCGNNSHIFFLVPRIHNQTSSNHHHLRMQCFSNCECQQNYFNGNICLHRTRTSNIIDAARFSVFLCPFFCCIAITFAFLSMLFVTT